MRRLSVAGKERLEKGKNWRLFLLGLSLLLIASPAFQAPRRVSASRSTQEYGIIIDAEADAYVRSDKMGVPYSDENFGSEQNLLVQNLYVFGADDYRQVSYFRFRITRDNFPANAVPHSALLQVFFVGTAGSDVVHLDIGRAYNDWDEYKITYNSQPAPIILINTPQAEISTASLNGYINILEMPAAPEWTQQAETVYTFWIGVVSGEVNGAEFSSREGGNPPRMVIYYDIVEPSPTKVPVQPSPTKVLVRPSPTKLPVRPSPTKLPVQPPPTKLPVRPSPTKLPVQPPPTKEPVQPSPEPRDDCPLIGCQIPCPTICLISIAVALVVTLIYIWSHRRPPGPPPAPPPPSPPKRQPPRRQPPPQEPPGSEQPPPVPPVPPLRLLRIWLTENGTGRGPTVSDNQPLAADQWYSLHGQITVREMGNAQAAQPGLATDLQVVLFSPETDFVLGQSTGTISIPTTGDSTTVHLPIRPLLSGRRRIRACIYYKNVLLQTAILDAGVVPASTDSQVGALPVNFCLLDYVASPDLLHLERYSNPKLSIFTNQAAYGAHWIGLYAASPGAEQPLFHELYIFPPDELYNMAKNQRSMLTLAQGLRKYRPDYPLPLDDRSIKFSENLLIELAISGFNQFDALFLRDRMGMGKKRLQDFTALLGSPGLIQVARCIGSATSYPWASLYTFPLDQESIRKKELQLCEFFKQELRANRWSGKALSGPAQDNLDVPQSCLARPGCPVSAGMRQVVCPFGFWGFMHQIEQPLQQVTPTPVNQTPEMLLKRRYSPDWEILWKKGEKLHFQLGINPVFPSANQVYADIQAMTQSQALDLVCLSDSNQILKSLKEGGGHLYYYFCHGATDGNVFKLDFHPGSISSASLYPQDFNWPEQPKPLFILNACGSVEITPEVMHGLLDKLHLFGASGVVGTEISVYPILARTIGKMLIENMLNGDSIGEAFLRLRRQLQRQGNPLGLVYTFYAWADLHLHYEGKCSRCAAQHARKS